MAQTGGGRFDPKTAVSGWFPLYRGASGSDEELVASGFSGKGFALGGVCGDIYFAHN